MLQLLLHFLPFVSPSMSITSGLSGLFRAQENKCCKHLEKNNWNYTFIEIKIYLFPLIKNNNNTKKIVKWVQN